MIVSTPSGLIHPSNKWHRLGRISSLCGSVRRHRCRSKFNPLTVSKKLHISINLIRVLVLSAVSAGWKSAITKETLAAPGRNMPAVCTLLVLRGKQLWCRRTRR